MAHFDINRIIEQYKPDLEKLAAVLFPDVRYTRAALNRVINGTSLLDTEQIEALADYLGVLVQDLFIEKDDWHSDSENGSLVFIKEPYKAKLNFNGVYLTVYNNDEVIKQELVNVPNMTVNDFIDYLNNIIKNYEYGNYQDLC